MESPGVSQYNTYAQSCANTNYMLAYFAFKSAKTGTNPKCAFSGSRFDAYPVCVYVCVCVCYVYACACVASIWMCR